MDKKTLPNRKPVFGFYFLLFYIGFMILASLIFLFVNNTGIFSGLSIVNAIYILPFAIITLGIIVYFPIVGSFLLLIYSWLHFRFIFPDPGSVFSGVPAFFGVLAAIISVIQVILDSSAAKKTDNLESKPKSSLT